MLCILDSGHNEKVAGKKAPDNSLYEWQFNNYMQTKIKKRLEDHNISIYLTNPSPAGKDEIGLSKRAELANNYWTSKNKPKALFVSLHANAYGSVFNTARGTETFVAGNASSNSKNAAQYVNDEIYAAFKKLDAGAKNRGVKTSDLTVIYKSAMPAILVEYGFYTNEDDLKILKNNKNELVEATTKGICKYFGVTYKSIENKPSTDSETFYRVVSGSFNTRALAEAKIKELESKGFKDTFLTIYNKE